jgi:methylenetetrahydrofolate--tRNA-(uracil-5-)-methyltransferase
MAGVHVAALASDSDPVPPPRVSAFGSLVHYLTEANAKNFQPANITFDLLPALDRKIRDRQERHRMQCELALAAFDSWIRSVGIVAAKGYEGSSRLAG